MRKGANTTSDKWLVVTCEHHFNIKPELTKLTNESIRVITNKSVLSSTIIQPGRGLRGRSRFHHALCSVI